MAVSDDPQTVAGLFAACMLPPVRARLHVHPGDPREPEQAARRLVTELLRELPHQRPTSVVLLALGPHPGLVPTPWLLDGLFEALIEAERTPVSFVTLGDHDSAEAALRKAGRDGPVKGDELIERPNRDRQLSLRTADRRKPLAVLRELVGTNVIVCAPLCFMAREQASSRTWQGPLAGVLSSMAYGHGFSPPTPKLAAGLRPRDDDGERAALAVGHELLEACFASASVILDATWAAALEQPAAPKPGPTRGPDGRFVKVSKLLRASEPSGPTLLGELAPVERALGVAAVGRTSLPALLGADRFLLGALGLDNRSVDLPPEIVHTPGRWPTLSLPTPTRSQPKRLADRAIAGIRSQATRITGAQPAALPARVPGEFAALWTRRWYGEHVRSELG